jgi:hypothetical protein
MTDLTFTITDAQPAPQTAAPAVNFRIRIRNESAGRIHALALRCTVRIDPRGRRYTSAEAARLYELFGDVSQWDRTLAPVTWAQSALLMPSFDDQIDVDLPVACTYDLEVGSAKYLHAVRESGIPLTFLFSGMVFTVRPSANRPTPPALWIEPVPWSAEAAYVMPAHIWQATMDRFFPGEGWLRLRRDTIDRLQAFRGRQAVVSWDEAIEILFQHAEAREPV